MKFSIASEAEEELVQGARYYASHANVELGLAFVAEFERLIDLLRAQPALGAPWRGSTRRFPSRRFPYSIVYQLSATELRIIALAHQRRQPGYWSARR